MIPYAIAAASLYALDRFIRFFWGLWPRKTVKLEVKPGNCVQVVFQKHPLARYSIGQYVFMNFPGFSLLEWHPYTLSSGPNEDTAEVHIKGLGDHTKQFIEKAANKDQMYVRIEGPYGKFNLNYKRYPSVILVGGGVGITPLIAMIKDMYNYNMSSEQKQKNPLSPHLKEVTFVWSCVSEEVFGWFSDVVEYCEKKSSVSGYPKINFEIFITRAKTVSNPILKAGRPDLTKIFKIVGDTEYKRIAVFACGPSALVNSCWDESVKNSVGTQLWEFHHETFDF